MELCPTPLKLSVSATTRPPREGEREGVEYFFLSQEEFLRLRDQGEFLEHKEVFGRGYYYGTLRSEVSAGLDAGKYVVLEIDVEGAKAVLESEPDAITIFVHPGSMEELERRLRGRGTDSEEAIRCRLEAARREMEFSSRYRYQVVNTQVDQAANEICEILSDSGE